MAENVKWPPRRGMSLADHSHPPGGRCMPTRCYCTQCPGYVPLRKDSASLKAAAADLAKKDNSAAHAKSWAEREEPTWLDDK